MSSKPSVELNKLSKSSFRKSGFTLIELMVYIALVGLIVMVAGRAFVDSTRMRFRTQNMMKANMAAEDVASWVKFDVSQMGSRSAKNSESGTTSTDVFDSYEEVYVDVSGTVDSLHDSSSFVLKKDNGGSGKDSLMLRRVRYDASDAFAAVEEVSWWLSNDTLKRSCKTLKLASSASEEDECPSSSDDPVVVTIATKVDSFSVVPGKPGDSTGAVMFPTATGDSFRFISRFGVDSLKRLSFEPDTLATSTVVSGFTTNYDASKSQSEISKGRVSNLIFATTNRSSDEWQNCDKMDFYPDTLYEISFAMALRSDYSRNFLQGVDHMAVGLRSGTDGSAYSELPDFMFYPPEHALGAGTRVMRFSVPKEITGACVAFSFAMYSPMMGSMTLSNLKVKKVRDANYNFDDTTYDPDGETSSNGYLEKKNIRGLMVRIVVKENGDAGRVQIVVPTPSNGTRG